MAAAIFVSCASLRLNELYDLNGCFATVTIIPKRLNYFKHYCFRRQEILILSDLLRANLEKPRHGSRLPQFKCNFVSPRTKGFFFVASFFAFFKNVLGSLGRKKYLFISFA